MQKQLTFHGEAREAILSGVEKLAKAVVSTLGPKGRCAVLDKSWGGPTITKDGVTVARDIDLLDKSENLGAQLVKQAATKTNDRAGDGTTTATLLAWSLYREALRHLSVGANPAALIRGMQIGSLHVKKQLEKSAKPVKDNAAILDVATIASNNDAVIGNILAKAFKEVGNDGVITIEEGKSLDTEVKVVKGMQFDRGFLSPNFATNPETLECVYDRPLILIHEEKISTIQSLLPALEKAKEAGKALVIIAESIEGEALATLVVNKMRGILEVVAIKAPGYGDRRKEMLRDIAVLTGANAIMADDPIDLENIELSDLGTAQSVRIDSNNTTIVKGAGKAKDVATRADQIRSQIESTTSDYDREKLEERLAKLVGGIAQVQVGGATEAEVKERKHRYEDAKHATMAAIESGILAGGGVALLRAAATLKKAKLNLVGEEITGVEILASALEQPVRTIASNAGLDGAVIARQILREKDAGYGFNALTEVYGDMFAMGIVDPTKVTLTALENAVSVAATLMTTECLIVEAKTKDNDEAAAMEGGHAH
ncbi:MAG: chaperonin GroEL [Planctomycetota bacterium]|nr:chaperonin GroEL [Planctomycetota bacterium]MDA1114481.1 chaperonin GroEL [Planctomycetota bacterium]